jgi:hypothetical protein
MVEDGVEEAEEERRKRWTTVKEAQGEFRVG